MHKCKLKFDHNINNNKNQIIKYWNKNLSNCIKNKQENKAWIILKKYGFVRQFFMGKRFFDFFHIKSGICIEIDGPEHCSKCDLIKDDYFLNCYKIQTFRIQAQRQINHLLYPITSNLKPLKNYDPFVVFQESYNQLIKK